MPSSANQAVSHQITSVKQYWDALELGSSRSPADHEINSPFMREFRSMLAPHFQQAEDSAAGTIKVAEGVASLKFPDGKFGGEFRRKFSDCLSAVITALNGIHLHQTKRDLPPLNVNDYPVLVTRVSSSSVIVELGVPPVGMANPAYRAAVKELGKGRAEAAKLNTTAACKELLARHYVDTRPADWRRGAKRTVGSDIVREFRTADGRSVLVYFDKHAESPEDALRIRENAEQNTEGISSERFGLRYGKPPYFCFGDNCDSDGVDFDLYYTDADGKLEEDEGDTYQVCEKIFKDRPSADIGAAELYHIIPAEDGESINLRKLVSDRLTKAGAVHDASSDRS